MPALTSLNAFTPSTPWAVTMPSSRGRTGNDALVSYIQAARQQAGCPAKAG